MFLRVHAIGKCRFSGLQLEDDGTPLVVTLLAEGTVVVDASAIPKEAAEQLALVLRDAEGERMAALSLGPAARFAALAPGEYSLALGLGTSDLLRLDGIVVPAGGTSVDPRLSPLALVHPIGERTFELYASDGATIRGARVQYWLSASTPEVRVNVRSSRIAVLDSADILRAAVIVDGYASVEVTRRTDGERLEFVPEVVIDLAFVGLSDRARNAHAKVLRVDSDLPGGDLDGYDQIPSDGVLRLRLPGPGSYQVSLQASYQTIGRYDFEVAPGATRVELDVR